MSFITDLRDRFVTKPVADAILKSLTPDLPQANSPEGSTGLQTFSVPTGFNNQMATYNKRMTSAGGVDWSVLRSVSINHETTRAAINVRKRQITQLNFEVVDATDDTDPETTQAERRLAKNAILHIGGEGVRFREILDKLIEDTLVLDALVFYKQRMRNGKLLRIVPIDGATIKLRVDDAGMRPLAPEIAFEQWIKGQKTAELTTDDLCYEMMNPRADNPYGLSPIESLLITIDSSMRAQLYNLGYLSDNSVPQGFINVPEEWKIQQIKEYTEYLHALISGPKAQAKIYPLPARAKYQPTSKPTDFAFKDFYDYLDRKVCMLFDVTPQELGLSLQQYKENADGQDKIQTRKGIKPLANFLQEIFTDLLQDELGYPNYGFKFTGLDTRFDTEDAKTLIPLGVLNIDEVRNDRGLKKLGAPNIIITPGGGITPVDQIEDNAVADLQVKTQAGQPPDKKEPDIQSTPVTAKAEKTTTLEKVVRNTHLDKLEKSAKYKSFHKKVQSALKKQLTPFTNEETLGKLTVAEKADSIDDTLPSFRIEGFDSYLKWVAEQGGQNAMDSLGIKGTFSLTNPKFTQLLGDRENYLIDSVDDTTKQWLVDQLQQGHTDKLTNAEIAQNIHDQMDEITLTRANTITNTETANASMQAELSTYKDQGITKKVWVLSEDIGDECGVNAEQGAIDVDSNFDSGDDAPPAHPNCRCFMQADVTSVQAMDQAKMTKYFYTDASGNVRLVPDGGNESGVSVGASNQPEVHTLADAPKAPSKGTQDKATITEQQQQIYQQAIADRNAKISTAATNLNESVRQGTITQDLANTKLQEFTDSLPAIPYSDENGKFQSGNNLPTIDQNRSGMLSTQAMDILTTQGYTESQIGALTPEKVTQLNNFATQVNNPARFASPLTQTTGNALKDAEHEIKYNAAAQAVKAGAPENVKELIYNVNVDKAKSPTQIASTILNSLPKDLQNHEGVQNAVTNWGKTAQMVFDNNKKN